MAISELADDLLSWWASGYPVEATALGLHGADDRWTDRTPDAYRQRAAEAGRFANRLAAESVRGADEEVDAQVIADLLRRVQREADEEFRAHERMPSLYTSEILMGIYLPMIREYAPLEERAAAVLERLRGVPAYLRVAQENLERTPQPRLFLDVADEEGRSGLQFLKGMVPQFAQQVESLRPDLLIALEEAATAMEGFLLALDHRREHAVAGFGLGEAAYTRLLREEHHLEDTPRELQHWGERILTEAIQKAQELAAGIDPSRSWQEILREAREVYPPAGELLETYRREVARARRAAAALLPIPSGDDLEVIETPAFLQPLVPYAAYLPRAPFERGGKGLFLVTVGEDPAILKGHSRCQIPVTVVHEAYPGHHVQLEWAAQAHPVRQLSQSALLAEGWAFTMEGIMAQVGFFDSPLERLAQVAAEIWRYARVVLDVRMQLGQMGVQEAADFLVEKAALEPRSALVEAKRYALSPTQPLAYAVGRREILAVRDAVASVEGNGFSDRRFFERFLSVGTVPPALIGRRLLA